MTAFAIWIALGIVGKIVVERAGRKAWMDARVEFIECVVAGPTVFFCLWEIRQEVKRQASAHLNPHTPPA